MANKVSQSNVGNKVWLLLSISVVDIQLVCIFHDRDYLLIIEFFAGKITGIKKSNRIYSQDSGFRFIVLMKISPL